MIRIKISYLYRDVAMSMEIEGEDKDAIVCLLGKTPEIWKKVEESVDLSFERLERGCDSG